MREIAYRVYVKDKKQIYAVKEIDFAYKIVRFEEENKPTDTMRVFDDVELMEFTGLTDKNGKQIFEGDIIDFDEKEWGCKHIEEVKFDYEYLDCRKNDFSQWCEVIGNIYDNPELLGGVE